MAQHQSLMPTEEELEVLNANAAFYAAFARRDIAAMTTLWSSRHVVACVHPGWNVLYGRDEVLASWKAILGADSSPSIAHTEARAFVLGDSAFVTCTEIVEGDELIATNVFAKETEGWRLVHHQAGPFTRSPTDGLSIPHDELN